MFWFIRVRSAVIYSPNVGTTLSPLGMWSKEDIKSHCLYIECGVTSARGGSAVAGVEGLPRSARPGDWPWHAALLRTHVHACDAALIHSSWLITTASCFQVSTPLAPVYESLGYQKRNLIKKTAPYSYRDSQKLNGLPGLVQCAYKARLLGNRKGE